MESGNMQELTWRIINTETFEIMESDGLGVILRACKIGLNHGEKLSDMIFYHINNPTFSLPLDIYLRRYDHALIMIKLSAKAKHIVNIKRFTHNFRQAYK